LIKAWYLRAIARETQEKDLLKTRLEEKLEELKEKSDYYSTQQLLQRYDSKSAIPVNPERPQGMVRSSSKELQPALRSNNLPRDPSIKALSARQSSNPPLPPLPPPITPASFKLPSQNVPNIPQFHPSAFTPPSSPPPEEARSKTLVDRVLDLLVGEDENSPEQRYALICRHCRAHNGLAPPGETGNELGYLCGRCGGWNGPKTKDSEETQMKEEKVEPILLDEKPTPLNEEGQIVQEKEKESELREPESVENTLD
jgi:endoplasmic reticulum junction formation protein lunapark